MKKILKIKNIDAAYGEARVLFNISMDCSSNDISVIVGRNGAGKTTLFRIIAGFLKPTRGSVMFNHNRSQNLIGLPPYVISNLGIKYVAQDKSVFSDLTVKENLELAAYSTGNYKWDEVFEYFPNLKDLLNKKGAYLSGGERQMLIVGRALIGNPKLLLLDEPMEGLAPIIVENLIEAIKKIANKVTLIIIEQNLPVISELADKVFVIKEGKIITEIISKEDIKSATFEEYL
jgi:ABC-type branched-subunit amino acid transport system ATPase component